MLRRLERLPDGQAICHGDYHPGNLVITRRGPVVIDWMSASHGNPVADVARTTLMFRMAGVPEYYSPETQQAVDQARRSFYEAYLSAYLSRRPFPVEEIEAWIPVLAAARLCEGIVEEEAELVKLVEMQCSVSSRSKGYRERLAQREAARTVSAAISRRFHVEVEIGRAAVGQLRCHGEASGTV